MRYRTVGDMSCTAAVLSDASTVHDVITEVGLSRLTERGATRADDRLSRGRDGGPQARGVLLMSASRATPAGATRVGGRTLLRLATAGSVDDGKSTLVGRLLFDTNSVLTDTLDHVEQVSRRKGLDQCRPGSADRRSARRARAGHHHRRRLPLLRHPGPQVHPGRLPRVTCSTPGTP